MSVISDFSALKGKVSFSEKISEEGLKVGQSVVLMDYNLRGKIVGLGKKVRIELEDGLLIESAYGEFAVTDKAEIASLKESKVKVKKTGTASKQFKSAVSSDGTLTVDLHIEAIPGGTSVPKGQQLQFQMDSFRKVIRENISHKGSN